MYEETQQDSRLVHHLGTRVINAPPSQTFVASATFWTATLGTRGRGRVTVVEEENRTIITLNKN